MFHRLPTYPTPFVGRQRERVAVEAALANAQVTLSGAGGVGKTRLAAAIASTHSEVVFCRLEGARQAADVTAAFARALELPLDRRELDPGRTIEVELAARGRLLVVLDNVEHLRSAMESLLPRWLAAAPQARFLVTSRWPLRLPGEVVVAVGPLGREGAGLFRQVAPVALPQTPETESKIESLVRHLDGLPLAIELAAARLEVLSLDSLCERLAERFSVLRDPERTDERHGTLWNTVAWSWALLARWEQVALARLSVFEGRFSLAAAEAVLDVPGGALDAIHALHRKALLTVTLSDGKTSTAPAGDWYALPETIRAFAGQKLSESGIQGEVEARHTRWFLAFAKAQAGSLEEPMGAAQTEALSAELPEIKAALTRTLATHPPTVESATAALAGAKCLHSLMNCCIPATEAEALLSHCLAHAAEARRAPDALAAEVMRQRARALRYLGRMDESLVELEHAEALAGDDTWLRARIANSMAEMMAVTHRLAESRQHAQTALALHQHLGNRHGEGISSAQIGLVESFQGNLREARQRWETAHALLEGTPDRFFQAIVLGHLASLALETGDLESARAHTERALVLQQAMGNRRSVAITQGYRALCFHHTGAQEAARAEYREVITALDRVGESRFAACYRLYDALLDLELGLDPGLSLADIDGELQALGERRFLVLTRCARAALAIRNGAEPSPELAAVAGELRAVADPLLTPIYGLPLAAALLAREAPMAEIRFQSEMMDQVAGDDARLAARVVRAWIAAAEASAQAWRFAEDGHWFHPHGGERVDLAHRVPLTRLLATLLAARGAEVPRDTLIAAGWPGERLLPEAAGNRLRVGLSTLRGLGLSHQIERTEQGYRLAWNVPVEIIPASPDGLSSPT